MGNFEKEDKTFDKSFWSAIIPFIIAVVLICFLPFLFTLRNFLGVNFSNTGSIGGTIGGTMGPFIAIVAAGLTFIAFWVQYKSNLRQTKQFKKQDLDTRLDRFENKFYELIRLHRSNVEEFNIEDKIKGRKYFVHMFYEFRFIFHVVRINYLSLIELKYTISYTHEELTNIAWLIFFFGVGDSSDKALDDLLKNYEPLLIKRIKEGLIINQRDSSSTKTEIDGIEFRKKYKPFNGHMSRLGHYFRLLFQIVKFVDQSNEIEFADKFKYLKTLRAQLSNHEQLLLFYDTCSALGYEWNKRNYIVNYRLIKNIPLPLADFGVDPLVKYKDKIEELKQRGKHFFEWQKINEETKDRRFLN